VVIYDIEIFYIMAPEALLSITICDKEGDHQLEGEHKFLKESILEGE